MTTSNDEHRTGEPSVIPQRRSEGIAGPSREVSQRDQNPSCTPEGAGRENDELAWAQRHIPEEPVSLDRNARPRLVRRKTEMIGCGVPAGKKRTSALREKAGHLSIDLPPEVLENNGEIVFLLLDQMHRIAERQDKKIDGISRRLSALEERGGSP